MRKEIKFESSSDLAKYLMGGDVLYFKTGDKIYYNVGAEGSPFRYSRGTGDHPMFGSWIVDENTYYEDIKWKEDILKGECVLCWVSDEDEIPAHGCYMALISKYYKENPYPYRDLNSVDWKFAIPVKSCDIKIRDIET